MLLTIVENLLTVLRNFLLSLFVISVLYFAGPLAPCFNVEHFLLYLFPNQDGAVLSVHWFGRLIVNLFLTLLSVVQLLCAGSSTVFKLLSYRM